MNYNKIYLLVRTIYHDETDREKGTRRGYSNPNPNPASVIKEQRTRLRDCSELEADAWINNQNPNN